jgi:hypothetical protein
MAADACHVNVCSDAADGAADACRSLQLLLLLLLLQELLL